MDKKWRKRLVLAKVEATYGVDAVPTPEADALLVYSNLDVIPLEQDYVEADYIQPYFGSYEQIPTNGRVRMTLEIDMTSFPVIGVPTPSISALLQSGGLLETITEYADVSYTPKSEDFKSATIYFYLDGVLHSLTGARNSGPGIMITRNQIPKLRFEVVGLFNPVVDAVQGDADFTSFQQPVIASTENTTAFSIAGFANACLQSLELNGGGQLEHLDFINCPEEIDIVNRSPTGTAVLAATDMATKNWFNDVRNGVKGALSLTHGPAGNQITFTAPVSQITNPRYSEQQMTAMLNMDIRILPNTGNDDFTLIYR